MRTFLESLGAAILLNVIGLVWDYWNIGNPIWMYPGGVVAFLIDWFTPKGIGHAWGYVVMLAINVPLWTLISWGILLLTKSLFRK